MHYRTFPTAVLAVLGLALAGCSTTGGDYSSLPPSPKRPQAAAPAPSSGTARRAAGSLPRLALTPSAMGLLLHGWY